MTGRANNCPVGVAKPHDLSVIERFVDGVRADRLVEYSARQQPESRRVTA